MKFRVRADSSWAAHGRGMGCRETTSGTWVGACSTSQNCKSLCEGSCVELEEEGGANSTVEALWQQPSIRCGAGSCKTMSSAEAQQEQSPQWVLRASCRCVPCLWCVRVAGAFWLEKGVQKCVGLLMFLKCLLLFICFITYIDPEHIVHWLLVNFVLSLTQ